MYYIGITALALTAFLAWPTETNSQVLTYHSGSTLSAINLPEYKPLEWEWQDAASTSQYLKEKQHVIEDNSRLLCNCYAYVKEVHNGLPNTSVIKSNLTDNGNVAVFYYPTSGVYHYAVVIARLDSQFVIDETNFRTCQFTRRVLDYEYPYLIGFYQV